MPFPLQLQQFLIQGRYIQLFVPDAAEVQAAYKKGGIPFPYWSRVWPSAVALSRFLASHPQYTQNKKVLELAAGLGLPSMVAAANAQTVLSSDYLPEAVNVISKSAAHNNIKHLTVALLNWHSLPQEVEVDVLLLSDINYDPAVFGVQQELITRFLKKGAGIILSTPQRLMGKKFIAPLLCYCVQQEEITVMQGGNEVMITVMVLQRD